MPREHVPAKAQTQRHNPQQKSSAVGDGAHVAGGAGPPLSQVDALIADRRLLARTVALFDVGVPKPVLQGCFAGPEAGRDLFDGVTALAATSDRDDIHAEPSEIRTKNDEISPPAPLGTYGQLSPIRSSRPNSWNSGPLPTLRVTELIKANAIDSSDLTQQLAHRRGIAE